jgi:site-specific DNA recombinase
VYKVDRMARSLRVLLDGYTALEAAGVAFKSATEPFDTSTSMGKFVFQMLGSMAELDRSNLLDRMNLGRDRVTRDGKWVNGPIPLGYMLDSAGCLIPSTRMVEQLGLTEAELIRDIFTRIAQGSSAVAEAARLQALDVPLTRYYYSNGASHTLADGVWYPRRILKMVQNPTYAGVNSVHSRFGTITRDVPALVSQALWDAANAQIRRNKVLPKSNATRVYLLRGIITCGLCGRSFVGQRVNPEHRPGPGWYYRCNGKSSTGSPRRDRRCKARMIQARRLEEHIWSRCRYFILHPDETMAEIHCRMQQAPQPVDTTEQEQALAVALAEKQQDEARLLTVFRRGRITLEAFEQEMDRIDQERDLIQHDLQALTAQHKRQGERRDYVARASALMAHWRQELSRIEADDDREAKHRLITDFVASITVRPDGVHVVYRFEAQEPVGADGPGLRQRYTPRDAATAAPWPAGRAEYARPTIR